MSRIDCLIFSKDRALQLNALLQTIHLAPYDEIGVLWTASDERFRKGYERVRWPLMAEEEGFELQVRRFVHGGTSEYVVFHTDDDLFFRRPPEPLPRVQGIVSLRLGANTTECMMGGENLVLSPIVSGDWLYWQTDMAEGDFAYPLSLNGHVVRRADLAELIDADVRFDSPTQLECVLADRASRLPHRLACAPRRSCVVSVPWNRVSERSSCPHADDASLTAGALNDRFLDGETLAPFAMDYSEIRSPHTILVPVFQRVGEDFHG